MKFKFISFYPTLNLTRKSINKANKTTKQNYIYTPFLDYSGLELGDFSRLKPQNKKQVKMYDNHDSRDNK